jgi:SAM-dependent methyltransferase
MYFDHPYYIEINEARWLVAKRIIAQLPNVRSCTDVGCGPGWFADRLSEIGLDVLGVDGRQELVDEAASRVSKARFQKLDIMSTEATLSLSPVDLVFCFGLLYHLENPFAAIRNLYCLTDKYLFIETQIAPGHGNNLILVSEGKNETQGLNFHAVIPSRIALLKMLYVAGFKSVHRFTGEIIHNDFVDTPNRLHRREVFLAVKFSGFMLPDFEREIEPHTPKIDYARL